MVCLEPPLTFTRADEQDFVLEDRHSASEGAGPAPGVHVEEGAILEVKDR